MSEEDLPNAFKSMNAIVEARVRLMTRLALLAGEELDTEAQNWIESIASTTGTVCREQAQRWFFSWFSQELNAMRIGGMQIVEPVGQYYALPFPGLCLYRAANRMQAAVEERLQGTANVLVRPYFYEETEEIGIMVEVFTSDRATCLADALCVRASE